jgi:hypothetical protein
MPGVHLRTTPAVEDDMQETVKREIILYTPNKRYTGTIDLKNDEIRTIDQLNSANVFWKNPNEKSFNDAILLYDVEVFLHGTGKLASFKKLQLRLSDIVFFSDKLKTTGDVSEKIRAQTLSQKSQDDVSKVRILTEMRGDSFYMVIATFHGLFKKKTQHRYMPLTEAKIYEVLRTGDKWQRIEIDIGNDFIGLSSNHIEACSFSDYDA